MREAIPGNAFNHPDYLEPLNSEQRRAVLHTGKPLLILAGAGSGKTRVITTKIAWLIREQGMDPRSILAVTFTNKAAREMAERARSIDPRAADAMLRTFHSFGAWFLRRNGSLCGLDSAFVIYDDDDVISLLSSVMENAPKAEVKHWAHKISRAKDYFLSPDDPDLAVIDHNKKFRSIYKRYEERMAQIGNVDFGDLIKKPVEILRTQPETAQRFRQRFSVIMVDEYQDANVAQFQLLKELCGAETYVCVVGDDDQSIYRFRGAEVKNILEFPDRFSGADVIRLEQNYRSTTPILKAASSVVDYNHGRLGKTLRAEKGDGPLPVLTYLPDQDEETALCADIIGNSVKKEETTWSDWAVLYRTNAQSAGFETMFLRRAIPYRVVGSLKFYEREEIKDALALLSFLVNPRDEVAFRRVVNKPTRGVGGVTVDKIVEEAISNSGNLMETGSSIECSQKARKGLDEFFKAIKDAKALLDDTAAENKPKKKKGKKAPAKKQQELKSGEGLSVCIEQILIDSGIAEYHKTQDEFSGNSKLSNLQELLNSASEYSNDYEGLLKFLEDIELDRSMREEADKQNNLQNSVTLITFHNTKGLEFSHVIMTGLEQGVFPREDKKDDELEEERRLFYVGATRAMDKLYLTTCAERRIFGRTMQMEPSLFLREIDRSCLQIENSAEAGSRAKSMFRQPIAGRSFNPLNLQSAANTEVEERAGWRRGQRLFHEDHGYGAVFEVKDSDDGPIVRVRFDNGSEKRFLPEIQGRAYEKVEEDY
ncbi:MAG: ATP-dependent helicase [Treponema sp.]|jgi:DNA helicase-2/ATP-dependent DNA helicase PcrA|nr:ATP-dependent helicase [Treponema sp.]